MNLPYYYSLFIFNGFHTTVIGRNSHPFKFLKRNSRFECFLISWREITKEEYEMFWELHDDKQSVSVLSDYNVE